MWLGVLLAAEALFAGGYVSITRTLYFLMLADMGLGARVLAASALASALASSLASLALYHKPAPLCRKLRSKLLTFHLLERLLWSSIPAVLRSMGAWGALLLYPAAQLSTVPVSILMNSAIYSSFDEEGVKTVTGWRNALGLLSSLAAQALAASVLRIGSEYEEYAYLYSVAALLGLLSWLMLVPARIGDPVEAFKNPPREVEEKAGGVLMYLVLLFGSSNLLGMVWGPYLIERGAPSHLYPLVTMAGIATGALASLLWVRVKYEYYLAGLALSTVTPILVAACSPPYHLLVAAVGSAGFTAASLIGVLLFSRTARLEGVLRSSIRLVAANSLGMLIPAAAMLALGLGHLEALAVSAVMGLGALAIAVLSIEEISPLPLHMVRMYGRLVYETGAHSYKLAIETSTGYVIAVLKLGAAVLILAIVYLVYRATFLLLGA